MAALSGASLALPWDRVVAVAGLGGDSFALPLPIPPVAKPVRTKDGVELYKQTMRRARVKILDGKETTIWGFDGHFPGPTIKATRGTPVLVKRKNALDVPTSTHLHGGKIPWRSDGHPKLLIAPGDSYNYYYPNEQDAATLWYHDHECHETSTNNYMGLAGLYILEDPDEADLNLPAGKFDIPLVLQDRRFRKNGKLRFNDDPDEVLGNVYLVNGRPTPHLKVAARKYRFRILNASHTRDYNLALDSGDPLTQIASDQGLLAAPAPQDVIPIWPAERVEVVIDFSRFPVGSKIVLQDQRDPADPASAKPIMRFDVAHEADDDSSLPPTLRTIERLLPDLSTVQREFELSQDVEKNKWLINGKGFDVDRIDFKPRLGDTEIWTFRNASSTTHPMHIHLVRFQILDRSNLAMSPGEMGWKDTVRVDASSTVRVIMRFEGFTGRYMFHCHNLAHEDHSMMGQMKVVPGDSPVGKPDRTGGWSGNPSRKKWSAFCELLSD